VFKSELEANQTGWMTENDDTRSRYFKRFLKCTPLNYVIDYRIQKSLYLLQQGDSNITEVAYQVDFNRTSYFIKEFRNPMNMTPLAYKKRNSFGKEY
jgi:AraC family transcriptional regulator, melibiose operon regulatory protein